ncbi:MAG: rhodanese-like domain-containing protein [Bacteroidia bacterium]
MKTLFTFLLALTFGLYLQAQQLIWKKEQLMPTKELADKINTNAKDKPLIFNMGPMDNIKSAVFIGRGTSVTGIEKLKSEVMMENKNRVIVVYCGCCSYASCPNIKPAYDALISAGFKNAKVLELPEGIAPDWIAKGYPME